MTAAAWSRTLAAFVWIVAAAHASGQSRADTTSVEAFYMDWLGPSQQDPDVYASFYEADGYILPPNGPPVRGREAIAEWQRVTRAQASYSTRPEGIRTDEIRFLSRDWVLYRGTLWGQRIPVTGGSPVPFETKYLDLLHRADGREWKVAYRMWSDSK
jgi:ketosteroid isomerase-like protein